MQASGRGLVRPVRVLIVFVVVMLLPLSFVARVSAQACKQKASAQRDIYVYNQPPAFVTGKGLVYGQTVAKLSPLTTVFICGEARVGFGLSTQSWNQIAYWRKDAARWLYGWVAAEDLRRIGGPSGAVQRFGITTALAALPTPAGAASGGTVAQTAPAAPLPVDQPPADATSAPPPPAQPEGQPRGRVDSGPLLGYYFITFLVVLGGGVSKTFVTLWTQPQAGQSKLVALLIALFKSPLVVLAFLGSVQLAFGNADLQSQIMFFLLAFQFGYLGETVTTEKQKKG